MVWHIKLISEDNEMIKIAYSCENDMSLDGILAYDKQADKFVVEKLSNTSTQQDAKRAIGHLWDLIGTDKLSSKTHRICAG